MVHKDPVPPKVVGRIEGCDHAKAQGAISHLLKLT
jgi:hypothetical protein